MAIDFKQFAQKQSQTAATKDERPAAKYWLNIGYSVEVQTEEGKTESRFISLPVGIPVDTMEQLPIKSSNDEYNALQAARNNLLDQIMAAAANIGDGEEEVLNLEIRLRKVNGKREVVTPENNPFIKKVL